MIKVLNLYAGIGGNRKLWKNVEVTAIENNKEIAKIYQDFFLDDKVIICDAHHYLLKHFKEFDFIWSSPPYPTHSRTNKFLHARGLITYPDMSLYQEIIFLQAWHKGKWIVENVIPYYEPLVSPTCLIGRHYIWSNFKVSKISMRRDFNMFCPSKDNYEALQKYHGFDLSKYKKTYTGHNHDYLTILRNCVNPKLGLHIFNCAFREKQEVLK